MSHKTPLEAAGEAAAAKGREAFGGMFVNCLPKNHTLEALMKLFFGAIVLFIFCYNHIGPKFHIMCNYCI